MPVLTVEPEGLFRFAYRVVDGGITVARIQRMGITSVRLAVGGVDYTLRRKGLFRPSFELELGGRTLASAQAEGFMWPGYRIEAAGRQVRLVRKGMMQRQYALMDGERELGTMWRKGMWRRAGFADFPADIDLPTRVFLIFLVLYRWRKHRQSSAAASG